MLDMILSGNLLHWFSQQPRDRQQHSN